MLYGFRYNLARLGFLDNTAFYRTIHTPACNADWVVQASQLLRAALRLDRGLACALVCCGALT